MRSDEKWWMTQGRFQKSEPGAVWWPVRVFMACLMMLLLVTIVVGAASLIRWPFAQDWSWWNSYIELFSKFGNSTP